MIWYDDLCRGIINDMDNDPNLSYDAIASRLSQEFGIRINAEQLRSGLRRYKRRMLIPPSNDNMPVVHPLVIQRRLRLGALGDTHLCSNYEDLTSLNHMYDIYQQEGITDVYHTGNWVDGESRFNSADLRVRGMDSQMEYFIDKYPRRENITTHFISGDDHEGWYTQNYGIDIGQHLEDMARRQGRNDLRYLGYMESDVPITLQDGTTLTMRVLHAGGGSAAAISHTSQKIVDSWDDYERPFILLVGHYHKAEYLPNYRGVRVVQTGTFQRQTSFMRKKRLHADIGGWILDLDVTDVAIRMRAEFINFAPKPWKHEMGMRQLGI